MNAQDLHRPETGWTMSTCYVSNCCLCDRGTRVMATCTGRRLFGLFETIPLQACCYLSTPYIQRLLNEWAEESDCRKSFITRAFDC